MNETQADRWEFSLLVDRANRILEARGLYELYLGSRPGQLINRQLVSFIAESGRLAFLRYMARLAIEGEAEPVIVTLATPAIGVKRFAMAAKHGEGGYSWWIMFAQEDQKAQALEASDQPFASSDELGMLADAHDHAKAPLDVTLFRAEALSTGRGLSPTGRKRLDDKLGEALLEHAHERIVARPEVGEYALLHTRDKDAAEIGQTLVAVAGQHDLPPQKLGLARETRRLGAESRTAAILLEMRAKIREADPVSPQGMIIASRWVPMGVTALCLFLLLAWLWLSRR